MTERTIPRVGDASESKYQRPHIRIELNISSLLRNKNAQHIKECIKMHHLSKENQIDVKKGNLINIPAFFLGEAEFHLSDKQLGYPSETIYYLQINTVAANA